MSNSPSVESKNHSFFDKGVISVSIILVISVIMRILLFPFNIPLTLDGLSYFFDASDFSILGHLTSIGTHDVWPIFLSFFFTIVRSDNFLDYMALQRGITIGLSVLTIIPVYFLCKRFIEKPYAIAATAIFAFDPRIIQNSLLGITEPLYMLLVSTAFALYFSSKRKLMYISFALIGLSCNVRTEGFFVFLPMIVMLYVRNRKEDKIILKVILAGAIFSLIFLPTMLQNIGSHGSDVLSSYISQGTSQIATTSHHAGTIGLIKNAVINVIKLGGWSLVPIFIVLLPIGLYFFIKEQGIDKMTIIVFIILMLFPVFYAFALNNQDTRYMYPLFPLFSVVSALTIKKALGKTRHQNIALLLVVGAILLVSSAFLEYKKFDYDHQGNAFGIAREVVSIAGGVNNYYPEDSYIVPVQIPQKWPVLKSSINFKTAVIPTDGFDSLSTYIYSSEKNGLTHLVVDGQKSRPQFLNDVFNNEGKYSYLTKVFDSYDHGYKYHVKIYKIDYDLFNKNK